MARLWTFHIGDWIGPLIGIIWVLKRFAASADLADMMRLSIATQTDASYMWDNRIAPVVRDFAPAAVITLS